MADWDLPALLLRLIEFNTRARLWQESGGKGQKPKPLSLPDEKARTSEPASSRSGEETARHLRNLGLIPADSTD